MPIIVYNISVSFKEVKRMPRRDGTGPMGEGKMTGRGLGNCDKTGEKTKTTFELPFGRGLRGNRTPGKRRSLKRRNQGR